VRVTPIERVGEKLRLLAQTKLPGAVEYLDLDDYREIVAAIRRLDVRGAPAIGIAAAYALAVAASREQRSDWEFLETVANDLRNARPTAVNLVWAVDRTMAALRSDGPTDHEQRLARLWREAEEIHEEDRIMCDKIGSYGEGLISDGDTILTHCNAGALATGGPGTALAVIYACQAAGKTVHVYADETRPLLQGARLTAWELMQEGIDVTLICDNTAATLMKQAAIQHVIVGTDRIAANGDVANKIGTYSVAVLAAHHGVPFYVAAPMSTFDSGTPDGDAIPIEKRAAEEVTEGFGVRTAPDGVKVYSPAFDVTPRSLVSAYITDQGIRPGGRG